MANNLTTQTATLATVPGASVIATRETGGVHYQLVEKSKGSQTSSAASADTTADIILAANTARKVAYIKNTHATITMYVGHSGVTTSNGFPMEPGDVLVDDYSTAAWYGITSSGTGTVRVIEVA